MTPVVKPSERTERLIGEPGFWFGLVLLTIAVPLFLRMPLTNDTEFFDLQTRLFAEGAVPYRDVLEPNWPGVFWIHSAVRRVLGDRSEAMRLFDLSLILFNAWTVRRLVLAARATSSAATWVSVSFLAFYLGCSEWGHCQRDTWLLAPMLCAIGLRVRRLDQVHQATRYGATICSAVVEGLLWGFACWLKPYAVLVGLAVWGLSLLRLASVRRFLEDTAFCVVGGAASLAGGLLWLHETGGLIPWLETLRDWSPRYLAAGRAHWVLPRFESMIQRLQPWIVLHVLALPLAVRDVIVFVRQPLARFEAERRFTEVANVPRAMLAGLYLTTMLHVFLLQHLFDYVHVPAVLLAIVEVGTWLGQPHRSRRWRLAVLCFGVLAALQSPILKPDRLRLWTLCVTQSSHARLQDRLALHANPCRVHIERVADFLRDRIAGQEDVGVFNSDLVSLYRLVQGRPPTRFVYVFELLLCFPDKRQDIVSELAKSGHRYVVSDLLSYGLSLPQALEVGPEGPHSPPPKFQPPDRAVYPWSFPVAFRSGPYLVHRISKLPGTNPTSTRQGLATFER